MLLDKNLGFNTDLFAGLDRPFYKAEIREGNEKVRLYWLMI